VGFLLYSVSNDGDGKLKVVGEYKVQWHLISLSSQGILGERGQIIFYQYKKTAKSYLGMTQLFFSINFDKKY
jgi:hypothetical protein